MAGVSDLSGPDLATHLRTLRERLEQQSKEWDDLLEIVGDVLEVVEERLDSGR